MSLEILNTKHHFVYILLLFFFLFYVIFIFVTFILFLRFYFPELFFFISLKLQCHFLGDCASPLKGLLAMMMSEPSPHS